MALILCKQQAAVPYYFEKLNIRLWSSQELCYLIYNYPLMVTDGLLSEDLIEWIGKELMEKELSSRLRQAEAEGETEDNMLLMILGSLGYYTRPEINVYMDRLVEISRYEQEEYLHAVGAGYFRADRLGPAYDKFEEAAQAADERMRRSQDPAVREKLLRMKADCYLDMAVVKILLFEDRKALELILQSELFVKTARAREMKYLLTGEADISDEDKKSLDSRKEETKLKILSGHGMKELDQMFRKDSVSALSEASELLGRLKKSYRHML